MTLSGGIDEIRFRNDENGYTIAVLDVKGEPVIIAGALPPVAEGETLKVTGDFVVHPKFGRQFKVTGAASVTPDSLDGIVRYLGSGLIKGIGPKTALSIVDTFGKATLDVIENNPSALARIKGISRQKAGEIAEAYGTIKQMREAMVYLQGHGLTLNLSLRIFKQYGQDTVAKVKSNPYRLIEDIDGVGFITADKIANSLGVERDSEFRIRAGLLYTLRESGEKNGNTFLPKEELCAETARLLGLEQSRAAEFLDVLVLDHRLKTVQTENSEGVMLVPTFRAEYGAAVNLVKLVDEADRLTRDCRDEIAEFERVRGLKLHGAQKAAVESAVNCGVTVITGGPGTGKTTIIKCILHILTAQNCKSMLMAPTGRAAKRLSESTGEDASTIHRALMLTHNKNANNLVTGEKLAVGAVIVDEFSMVDVFLLNSLLTRLNGGTRLILVGDADQLPSVGAGNVLKDIMASGLIPTVRLTQIYRQADASHIIVNAHKINNGEMPDLTRVDGDFFYSAAHSPEEIAEITVGMASKRIPNYLGIEPYRVQVLCPMKNGAAGARNLNRLLQLSLNGSQKVKIVTEDCEYRKGDKVMHIANNYNLEWRRIVGNVSESGEGVFNGDLGIIAEIREDSGEMDVIYEDGRLVTYTPDIRQQLIPAYAITVHKSQGSEFDAVILPVAGGNPAIMTRNLLYTAITRAKRMVVLVGDKYNIKRMVDNNYIAYRYSALSRFIAECQKSMRRLYGDGEAEHLSFFDLAQGEKNEPKA